MKTKFLRIVFLILFTGAGISLVFAWGQWGHKHISRAAVFALPNTDWVNAGSPNLISLDDPHLTKQNKKNFKTELKAWKKSKLLNLSDGVKEE